MVYPVLLPLYRWENRAQGRAHCSSYGCFQLCINQQSKFRKCERIMQCREKVHPG